MPVIYMDQESFSTVDNVDLLRIIDANSGPGKYGKLERYYVGDHDILHTSKKDSTAPNNRIVNNMAKYITDTAVGYFIGQPVVYSAPDAYMESLQDILDYNDEQDENTELAKKCSIGGNCMEMLYMDADARLRFTRVDPETCILIYDTGGVDLLGAIRTVISRDKEDNLIRKVECWDSMKCRYFTAINGGGLILQDTRDHYWQDVPFIEFVNNEERLGDYEGVISIIDAYNRAQSNSANFFQYNDEALLKILKIGDVTSQDIAAMKEKGAVILEDGGDVQWLLKEVNDTALENYKKRLREDMHIFSGVPNLTDANFGGNLSGVAVSYKLWGLEQLCAIKERKFKRGLQRRLELITTILNIQGGHYDYRDVDIQFRRNKPQNLLEIAQIITMLANDLSRESRLKMLPTVDSVKDELAKLAAEKQEDMSSFGAASGYDALAKALNAENAPPDDDTPAEEHKQ